ncbi:MAG: hypothetical protein LBC42_02780 [Puniceicoccales bacterium]|jgi:4-diphosphocytidyl-2-C-methyl-D-erythritol kinase|nr:hypothetical protein [Puniceicoccales bacterium]
MNSDFRTFACPAKLNLFLEINSRDGGGRHELTSVVVQLDFADRMHLRLTMDDGCEDFFVCDIAAISADPENTITRALSLYRSVYSFRQKVVVQLEKNIPPMTGMGGGSSNAAYFLKNLNDMLAQPLDVQALTAIAFRVGSDCPLFLGSSPCIVKSFGEHIENVDCEDLKGLAKGKFLIFKPAFGIPTAWAYEAFDRGGAWTVQDHVISENSAHALLRSLRYDITSSPLFSNAFQDVVRKKYVELNRIFADLEEYFKMQGYLTGSGSAAFIPMPNDYDCTALRSYLMEVLGENAFIIEAHPLLRRELS